MRFLHNYYMRRLHWYSKKLNLGIRRNALVLDVGCGGDPHPRADVSCDLLVDHKSGGSVPIENIPPLPFVIGNVEALPFKDKAFDYIICSNLLEHVQKPENALVELMRVGKAGFIETPSELGEKLLCGRKYHLWYVNLKDDRLVLRSKESKVFDPFLQSFFIDLYRCNGSFRNFHWANPDLFVLRYEWQDKIDFEINSNVQCISDDKQGQFPSPVFEPDNLSRMVSAVPAEVAAQKRAEIRPKIEIGLNMLIKSILRKILKGKKNVDLLSLLACPICKSPIQGSLQNGFQCPSCRRSFTVESGIPIMLSEY